MWVTLVQTKSTGGRARGTSFAFQDHRIRHKALLPKSRVYLEAEPTRRHLRHARHINAAHSAVSQADAARTAISRFPCVCCRCASHVLACSLLSVPEEKHLPLPNACSACLYLVIGFRLTSEITCTEKSTAVGIVVLRSTSEAGTNELLLKVPLLLAVVLLWRSFRAPFAHCCALCLIPLQMDLEPHEPYSPPSNMYLWWGPSTNHRFVGSVSGLHSPRPLHTQALRTKR